MLIYLIIKIIKLCKDNKVEYTEHLYNILKDIHKNGKIEIFENYKEYYIHIKETNKKNNKNTQKKGLTIPIYRYRNKGGYYLKYLEIIEKIMRRIIVTIIHDILYGEYVHEICPLESVIFYYMINVTQQNYSDIPMYELYNIIDIYSKSFSNIITGHSHCL
jgi:hypothetical protein